MMNMLLSYTAVWGRKPNLASLYLLKIDAGWAKSINQKELLSLDQLIGSGLVEVAHTCEKLKATLRVGVDSTSESDQENSLAS